MPAGRRGSITDKNEAQNCPSIHPTRNNSIKKNNFTVEAVTQGETVELCGEVNLALPATAEYSVEETHTDDESRENVNLAVENMGKCFSVVSPRSANSRRTEYVRGGYNRFVWNFRTTSL